jgi:hypothetical protein
VGLITFIVTRKRRSKNKSVEKTVHQKDLPMTPASNYGKIAVPSEYESLVFATNSDTGYEVGNINNYGIANIASDADANYEKSNIEL